MVRGTVRGLVGGRSACCTIGRLFAMRASRFACLQMDDAVYSPSTAAYLLPFNRGATLRRHPPAALPAPSGQRARPWRLDG